MLTATLALAPHSYQMPWLARSRHGWICPELCPRSIQGKPSGESRGGESAGNLSKLPVPVEGSLTVPGKWRGKNKAWGSFQARPAQVWCLLGCLHKELQCPRPRACEGGHTSRPRPCLTSWVGRVLLGGCGPPGKPCPLLYLGPFWDFWCGLLGVAPSCFGG